MFSYPNLLGIEAHKKSGDEIRRKKSKFFFKNKQIAKLWKEKSNRIRSIKKETTANEKKT